MERSHSGTAPAKEMDLLDELVQLLTLALIRLTAKRPSAADAPWQAPAAYDPGVLSELAGMGLITQCECDKSLELTDHGLVVGERTALILADAFDRLMERQENRNDMPVSGLDDIPGFDPLPYRVENDRRVFRLRIELDLDGLHPCWREVLVPAACSFLDLHIVIQRIFNWYDEHLFNFEMLAHGRNLHMEEYAFQVPEDAAVPSGYALAEARNVLLGDVFPRSRTVRYSYDYGDGWEHKVKLLKTIKDAEVTAPQLVAGEGDAPPEDVGGPSEFEDFLVTISDPFNNGCLDALKWGEAQGYEPFDLKKKQRELAECFEDDRRAWQEILGSSGLAADESGSTLRFV